MEDWDDAVCRRWTDTHPGLNPWISDNPTVLAWAEEACLECPLFTPCQEYLDALPFPRYGVYAGVLHDSFAESRRV